MNTTRTEENNPVIDELFEQAARNKGFASLEEFAEVSSWLTNEVDPAAISEFMDDPASAPPTPKPEFKERFEAWLEDRRRRAAGAVQ